MSIDRPKPWLELDIKPWPKLSESVIINFAHPKQHKRLLCNVVVVIQFIKV